MVTTSHDTNDMSGKYDEIAITAHMQTASIDIAVSVGAGAGMATVYSCDLTHGYISINADYRS